MFRLIDLPYALDALEPVISARTLGFHHGKHLQAYVDNLNKLVVGTPYEGMALEEIVVAAAPHPGPSSPHPGPSSPHPGLDPGSPAIFNNAGQILNHNLYFTQFTPGGASVIPSAAKESPFFAQIEKQWGSLEAFKTEFVAKGTGLFGSGWVWLQSDAAGTLSIGQYPNADNPAAHGLNPLLTFDVWEHAYYLDYQNRRAAHLEALWGIVDWGVVEKRYD